MCSGFSGVRALFLTLAQVSTDGRRIEHSPITFFASCSTANAQIKRLSRGERVDAELGETDAERYSGTPTSKSDPLPLFFQLNFLWQFAALDLKLAFMKKINKGTERPDGVGNGQEIRSTSNGGSQKRRKNKSVWNASMSYATWSTRQWRMRQWYMLPARRTKKEKRGGSLWSPIFVAPAPMRRFPIRQRYALEAHREGEKKGGSV